jgi:hypothetical protein
MERDLLIEGTPEDLEQLRVEIEHELGRSAHVEPVTSLGTDEYREPITIGLIIAFGGPRIVKGVVRVVNRFMEHREQMAKLENARQAAEEKAEEKKPPLQFIIVEGDARRPISKPELEALQ